MASRLDKITWGDFLLIPNLLTSIRIVSIPLTILAIQTKETFFVIFMMALLFVTDFLDGAIARKFNQVSMLGAILDPVADKFVVLSLFGYYFYTGEVPWVYWCIVLIRDISQLSAIPILIFWRKILFKVQPKFIPKLGTSLNFFILAIIIIGDIFPSWKEKLEIWEVTLLALYWISGLIEIYILFTFVPRFRKIYIGTHDTFE